MAGGGGDEHHQRRQGDDPHEQPRHRRGGDAGQHAGRRRTKAQPRSPLVNNVMTVPFVGLIFLRKKVGGESRIIMG